MRSHLERLRVGADRDGAVVLRVFEVLDGDFARPGVDRGELGGVDVDRHAEDAALALDGLRVRAGARYRVSVPCQTIVALVQ